MMKIFSVPFKSLGCNAHLRNDVNFNYLFVNKGASVWNCQEETTLENYLEVVISEKISKGELEEEFVLIDIGNVCRRFDCFVNEEIVSEIGSDKNILHNGDLVIPKIQPRMGNIFTNQNHQRLAASSEFVEYKCKNAYPKYLFYLITAKEFQKNLLFPESGKTHRRVNPTDLLKMKVPVVSLDKQLQALKEIEKIEEQIKSIRRQQKPVKEIVDFVFSREFAFDFSIINEKRKSLVYNSSLIDFSNDELKFDISLKYRNIFKHYVKNRSSVSWVDIESIAEIKGGKRLPKGQNVVDEETEYRYVRVADLNVDGFFNLEGVKFISQENYGLIKNYTAKSKDILLTIVGATIGKCGIVPDELDGQNISENFARLRIRDEKKYSPEYVLFALMSRIAVIQIDELKGRSSQGKLAIFRVGKILIPDVSLDKQKEIAEKVQNQIAKQKIVEEKIFELRNQIDVLIENSFGC